MNKNINAVSADGGSGWANGDGGDFSIYAPDAAVQTTRGKGYRSERPPFRIVKDVVLVRSDEPGPGGYLDAIGNPHLPPKLRRRGLLGMLTCDPLLNVEAVAVLEVTPIPEE